MSPRHLAAALAMATAAPAIAECKWEWLCNGDGACKHMPVCTSVYETPPPRPTDSKPPAIPPLAMRPHTIAGMGVGGNSTLTCEHIMRQGRSGRWYWSEACFCTDPRRAKDSTGPFANIVRCDDRDDAKAAAKEPAGR